MAASLTMEQQSAFANVASAPYVGNTTVNGIACTSWELKSADDGYGFFNSFKTNVPVMQTSWYRHLLVIFSQWTVYYNATVNEPIADSIFALPKYC